MKSSGNLLFQGTLRDKVTSYLFHGELAKRHVAIESLNYPIAIRPHFTIVIHMNTVGIGIACCVQPITRAMFPIVFRRKIFIHQLAVTFSIFRRNKSFHVSRIRRQTGKIQRKSSN